MLETDYTSGQVGKTPPGLDGLVGKRPSSNLGKSRLVNRNVNATTGRTSMRLEPEVWDAIREICLRDDIDLGELIKRVEMAKPLGGRTSAVRVYVLQYYRAAATEEGHCRAGHGVHDHVVRFSQAHGSQGGRAQE